LQSQQLHYVTRATDKKARSPQEEKNRPQRFPLLEKTLIALSNLRRIGVRVLTDPKAFVAPREADGTPILVTQKSSSGNEFVLSICSCRWTAPLNATESPLKYDSPPWPRLSLIICQESDWFLPALDRTEQVHFERNHWAMHCAGFLPQTSHDGALHELIFSWNLLQILNYNFFLDGLSSPYATSAEEMSITSRNLETLAGKPQSCPIPHPDIIPGLWDAWMRSFCPLLWLRFGDKP